jgi:hypothetical protein
VPTSRCVGDVWLRQVDEVAGLRGVVCSDAA